MSHKKIDFFINDKIKNILYSFLYQSGLKIEGDFKEIPAFARMTEEDGNEDKPQNHVPVKTGSKPDQYNI